MSRRLDACVRVIARASLALAFLPMGCAHSIPEPRYSPQPRGAFEEVATEPPPARVEMVPNRPRDRRAIWIDGEWDWTGSKWSWQYGRWVVAPAGTTYARWALTRRGDGVLLFAPGAFRNARGEEVASPAALAVARARDESVVDAEGRTERPGPNMTPDDAPRSPPR